MNQLKFSNLFEKVVIQNPSVLVCSWLLSQFVVFAHFLNQNFDNRKHNKSSIEMWYGFWIFAPTYFFDIFILIYITVEQAGSAQSIANTYKSISLVKSTNYAALDDSKELEALGGDLGFNDPYIPGLEPGGADDEKTENRSIKNDGGDDYIDGFKMTPSDFARESALSRSLINKWLWTLPTFILASCKISFDKNNDYSWHYIFLPLYVYIALFLFVAFELKNWFMRSQRSIDREDREKERELRKIREDAKNQLKESEDF